MRETIRKNVFSILALVGLLASGALNLKSWVDEETTELQRKGYDYALRSLAEMAKKSGKVSISFLDDKGQMQVLSLKVDVRPESKQSKENE